MKKNIPTPVKDKAAAHEKKADKAKDISTLVESEKKELTNNQYEGVIDVNKLLANFHSNNGLLKKIVGMFIDKCPKALTDIHQAITSGNSDVLDHAAHALKGSIGHFAANAAYDAALKLETMGRNKDLTHAREAYATLEKEIERLKLCLIALEKENVSKES